MLAGAKVSRLVPFLQAQGFNVEGFAKGSDAMSRLRAAPCHVLLFELECVDMMGVDLARSAKIDRLAGGTLLVDEPMKSGMIISALSRGIDSFVALPPDETIFMERLEGLLLAQWGLVVSQQQQGLTEELAAARARVAQLETSAQQQTRQFERQLAEQKVQLESAASRQIKELEGKVRRTAQLHASDVKGLTDKAATSQRHVVELTREIGVLRDQLATMHLVTGAKTGVSDEGAARGFDDDVPITGVEHKRAPLPVKPTRATQKKPALPKSKPVPEQATDEIRVADYRKDVTSDAGLFDVPTLSTTAPPRPVNASNLANAAEGLADFEPLTTSSFGSNPHDARTLGGQTAARSAAGLDEFSFDEKTPAVGGPVPQMLSSARFSENDEPTAPRGHESSIGPRPVARSAHLDSQVVRDASRLVSIGDEEIIFLEDE